MPQTPGLMENIFNSTLLWPQQMLWRTWRAATDPDVDFFSEKGLADAALLPAIGAFASHEHDVMPDELFGENVGAQIAGSILTDPTFFMGGAYAMGGKAMKVAYGMSTALKKPAIAALMASAAGKGKTVQHLLKNSTAGEVGGIMERFLSGGGKLSKQAIKDGAVPLTGKEATALSKQLAMMRKLKGTELGRPFNEFIEQATKYQIAWGLPILQRFGVRHAFKNMKGYEGWIKYLATGTGVAAKTAHNVLPIGGWVSKVPFANAVLGSTFGAMRQAWMGAQVGGDTSHTLSRLLTAGSDPQQAIKWSENNVHNLFGGITKQGENNVGKISSRFAHSVRASFDKFMLKDEKFLLQVAGGGVGLQRFVKRVQEAGGLTKYQASIGKYSKTDQRWANKVFEIIQDIEKVNPGYLDDAIMNPSIQQAFSVVQGHPGLKRLGSANNILRQLSPGHDWTAFDQLGGTEARAFYEVANKQFGKMGGSVSTKDDFISNILAGHVRDQSGTLPLSKQFKSLVNSSIKDYQKHTATLGSSSKYHPDTILTATGEIATSARALREKAAPIVASIQESAYNFGKGTREVYNKAFISGTSGAEYKELNSRLNEMVAASGDQVKELGEVIFAHAPVAAKELGMEYDEFVQILNLSLQSSFLPEEVAHVAKYMSTGNANDTIQATKAVYNGLNRTLRALQSLEGVLAARQGTQGGLKKLYNVLQKQVYEYSLWADDAIDGVSARARFKLDMGESIANSAKGQKIYDEARLSLDEINDKFLTHGMNSKDWGKYLSAKRVRGGVILGELDPTEVDDLLHVFEKVNRSKLVGQEREDALKAYLDSETPNGPLTKFVNKYGGLNDGKGTTGLSFDDINTLITKAKQTSKTTTVHTLKGRTVIKSEIVQNLWKWTPHMPVARQQNFARVELAKWNLGLSQGDDGLWKLVGSEKLGLDVADIDSLSKTYKRQLFGKDGIDSKGYSTIKKLMDATRKVIRAEAVKKPTKKSFPFGRNITDLVDTTVPLTVPRQDVIDLTNRLKSTSGAFKGGDENINILDALRNRATYFDHENPLNTVKAMGDDAFGSVEDYQQLVKLKELRSKDARGLYDPIGFEFKASTEVSPPRTPTAVELEVRDTLSKMYGKEEVSQWLTSFARVSALQDEIRQYVQRAEKSGAVHSAGFQIPEEMVRDMAENMTAMQEMLDGAVRGSLGKVGKQLFDVIENTRKSIFLAADSAGTLTPGSPLGYLSRVLSKGPKERLNRLFSDGIPDDIKARLSARIGHNFSRASDHLTIEDLNQFYFDIKELQKGGRENVGGILDEIEKIYTDFAGVPGSKYKLSPDLMEGDPFLNILTSLSRSNQDGNFIQFFDDFLNAGATTARTAKDTKAISHVVGGKVVGWYDESDQMVVMATDGITLSNKDEFKMIQYGEKAHVLPSNPKGVVIEASDGHQFLVDASAIQNSHMSLLPLGPESYGINTPAKAMVKRLGRAEMDSTHIIDGNQLNAVADELMGQYVMYGAQGPITGAVRAASSSLEVTPIHWRTFDNVNYMIKAWQTVYRLPFHIANVVSGTFQAGLAGASPTQIMGGYSDAMRLLYSKQDFTRLVDMTLAGADLAGTTSKGLRILPAHDFVRAARRMGINGAERLTPDQIKKYGLDHIEDFYVPNGTGGQVAMSDVLIEAAKQGLFGTFSHSGLRAAQTTSDTILGIKIRALDPGWLRDNGLTRLLKRGTEAIGATPGGGGLRETSEILNRVGTVSALLRKGFSVKRAVELTKNAHVSYDAITNFERHWMRRAFLYYTFPRKFIPWAWKQFSADPSQLAKLTNTIRNNQLFTSAEGRPSLKAGDYRVDVGRMAASVEASVFFASFFDKIGNPIAETLRARPYDAYRLERELSTAGLFAPGGLTGTLIPLRTVLPSRDHNQTGNFMDQAMKMVYPIKYMAQMMGLQPTQEEKSPYVQYTDMEKFIANSDFGLGIRKVRKNHEIFQAYHGFLDYYNKLKLRLMSTEDPTKREALVENIHYLGNTLKGMIGREQTTLFT